MTERMDIREWSYRLYAGEPTIRTIAIIGAGFSGTVLATNLLELTHARPIQILLLDRVEIGRGLAYATRECPYLLNVPAGRMSAKSSDPLDFLAFVHRDQGATPDSFLPRELYGEYLQWNLARAQAASAAHVRLVRIKGSAIAIERSPSAFRIRLADGRIFAASTLVLALGNPPPARIPAAEAVRGSSRYVEDPWAAPTEFQAGESVLIVGTGPTMADVAIAGDESAEGGASIHALSRHGLIRPRQTNFLESGDERAGALLVDSSSLSTRRLFRLTRELCDEAQRCGEDWRGVISRVRALAPMLWRRLPEVERRRFLRHARTYWDLHRHRLPPAAWRALDKLRGSGTLQMHAGRPMAMQLSGKRIRVRWRARGELGDRFLTVDRVINCTGPDYDVRNTRDRLLRSLFVRGLATPDPLGLGLLTDAFGALLGANGRPVEDLYYVGPMLRADHWEATAVQELRVHAEELARHLAPPEANRTTLSREAATSGY